MNPDRLPIWNSVINVIDRAPLGSDDKLRLQHFTMLLFIGVPSMLAFALVVGLKGERTLCLSVLLTVCGLVAGWILISRGVRAVLVYRTDSLIFCALLLYMAVIGGQDGSKILWTYAFPLIGFFLMGKREGMAWVAAVYGMSALIVLGRVPGIEVYPYSGEFAARYLVTMLCVVAIAYGFEHFRELYRLGMEQERSRLQRALEQVKTLSGLLPICSGCKKIRDDQGYWNQLESYLDLHTDVRFSHGLCPDCIKELFPGYEDEPDLDGDGMDRPDPQG